MAGKHGRELRPDPVEPLPPQDECCLLADDAWVTFHEKSREAAQLSQVGIVLVVRLKHLDRLDKI